MPWRCDFLPCCNSLRPGALRMPLIALVQPKQVYWKQPPLNYPMSVRPFHITDRLATQMSNDLFALIRQLHTRCTKPLAADLSRPPRCIRQPCTNLSVGKDHLSLPPNLFNVEAYHCWGKRPQFLTVRLGSLPFRTLTLAVPAIKRMTPFSGPCPRSNQNELKRL